MGHTIRVAVQASNCTGTRDLRPHPPAWGKGILLRHRPADLVNIRVGETAARGREPEPPGARRPQPQLYLCGMTDTDGILSGEPAISGSTHRP